MRYDKNFPKTIQVLVVACPTISEHNVRTAWLHGYALLTIAFTHNDVQLTGKVSIGERYSDDNGLIASLEAALDPEAVLAGIDLTDIIGRLGCLPIGVSDQKPALALLEKIQEMLANHAPLDLTLDRKATELLALNVNLHDLLYRPAGAGDAEGVTPGEAGSLNPDHLVAELADAAGAAALTLADLYCDARYEPALVDAWTSWRQQLQARWQSGPATGMAAV